MSHSHHITSRYQPIPALRKLLYPETSIIALFYIFSLYIGPNKYFLILLLFLITALWSFNRNFFHTLWLAFISTSILYRGRIYSHLVIPATYWPGGYPLTYNLEILFTDLLFFLLLYLILSRKSNYASKLNCLTLSSSLFWSLLIIIPLTCLSSILSPFPTTSFYFFLQFIKYILLFFVTLVALTQPQLFKKTKQIIALIVFANAILIISQWFHHGPFGLLIEDQSSQYGWYADENPGLYRPGGFYADPNLSGTMFAVFLPPLLLSTLLSHKLTSPIKWVPLILIIIALLLTASRSAILIACSSSLVLLFWLNRNQTITPKFTLNPKAKLISFMLLICLVMLSFNRLLTLKTAFSPSGGGSYRLSHLAIGYHYLTTQPLGIGLGVFPYAMAINFPINQTGLVPNLPHNFFAEISAEFGILGSLIILLFIVNIILIVSKSLRQSPSPYVLGYLLSYLSFIILMQFFPWFINPKTAPWFWFLSAFTLICPYEEPQNS